VSSVDLTGQVALVTGGGRGIGRAIARAFARAGADIAVAARTPEEIEVVAGEIRAAGRGALAIPVDVTNAAAVDDMVHRTLETLGRIDLLVNNAGGGIFRHTIDYTPEEWDGVIALNLRSVFLCVRAVAPHMLARGSGRILNLSSMAAYRGLPEYSAYGAAKAAVNYLTQALSEELRHRGVTVNALCPGPVASRLRSSHFPDEDPSRIMQPETVADVALFLASSAAAGISGATINVNHFKIAP
jgi:NAD(P)-dependent dehydrogenase (short-subunit alcohol dehydrogenase family)